MYPGSNEASAVNEAVASIFSAISNWDNQTLDYDATMQNGITNKHEGSISNTYAASCAIGVYDYGRFFREAVWELAWNRNCSSTTCSGGMSWSSTGGNGFSSASEARADITEALSYALSVTGSNATFNQIGTHMYSKLISIKGTTTANAFKSILSHHGLSI